MYECRVIGVDRIVAPMVESAYALEKFLAAAKMAFPATEREDIVFAVNVETISACRAFDEMLALPDIDVLGGVVHGARRSDRLDEAQPRRHQLPAGIRDHPRSAGEGQEANRWKRPSAAAFRPTRCPSSATCPPAASTATKPAR